MDGADLRAIWADGNRQRGADGAPYRSWGEAIVTDER